MLHDHDAVPRRPWPGGTRWGAPDAALVFTAGVLVAETLGRVLPAGMGPQVLLNLVMHATFLAGILLVARHRGYTPAGLGLRWPPSPSPAAILRIIPVWAGVLAVQLGAAAVSVAVLGVGPERLAGQLADYAADTGGLLLVADVTLTALVGPISEEIMFRGLLLGLLLAWTTRAGRTRPSNPAVAAAVLASAVAFAAVHGLFDPNSWRAVPAITVGGIVYGAVAVRDGHIMRAVVLHALTNGFVVAMTVWCRDSRSSRAHRHRSRPEGVDLTAGEVPSVARWCVPRQRGRGSVGIGWSAAPGPR